MTAKSFANNKNILFFFLFDILLLDCAIISHPHSSPFYVQKLNLNYRASRKDSILRGAEHGSSTSVCSWGWQKEATTSQDSALKIPCFSALWHKWPEIPMQMSTLMFTNSEEAVEKYCWNLGLVVLAGRTAGYRSRYYRTENIYIHFALVWVNFHWLLSCVREREKPRETAGRKTMGLHCISSKSSPVIPSTSQRIRSYIKLLFRNKPLQNLSHVVQKASLSLHYADLKAEEKNPNKLPLP